jgi:hypothetical protein
VQKDETVVVVVVIVVTVVVTVIIITITTFIASRILCIFAIVFLSRYKEDKVHYKSLGE